MQLYEQKYKPWQYYRQAVEVNQIDATVLAKELIEIYCTPTPKGWPELKKVSNLYWIDCLFFTIAGVWYLYPEPKNESYSSMTWYNLWYEENIPILR